MDRDISSHVTETYFWIRINTLSTTDIFGDFDGAVFIITDDVFAHHLAESLYDKEAMKEFFYSASGMTLMKIVMNPGYNFFELDFTMFNWNLIGEESKHFIWQ